MLGLAMVLNPYLLFPDDGTRITHERTPVVVEDGRLTYESPLDDPRAGAFVAVDCQVAETEGRDCALDRYVLRAGNLTVTTDDPVDAGAPAYARLDGRYYRRTAVENGTRVTYGLAPVSPRTLRTEIARNVTGLDPERRAGVGVRAAASGDPVTVSADEAPDEGALGRVYLEEGTYYTVVRTGYPDRALVNDASRTGLSLLGVVVLLVGVLVLPAEPPRGVPGGRD